MSDRPIEYVEIPGTKMKVRKDWVQNFEGRVTKIEEPYGGWWRIEVGKLLLTVHNNRLLELHLKMGDSVKGFYSPKDFGIWRLEKVEPK